MMKIKVYVDFCEEKVMTEKDFLRMKDTEIGMAMEDRTRVRDVLDALDVSAGDMFFMDDEDMDGLRRQMWDYLSDSFEDNYEIQEFELEV